MTTADWTTLIVSFALLLVSGGAAVAAVVQARIAGGARIDSQTAQRAAELAQRASQEARDEAIKLATDANDQFRRLADAQEQANQLTHAANTPLPRVQWQRKSTSRDSRQLVNIGNIAALNVVIKAGNGVFTDEDSQSVRVEPGNYLFFAVMPSFAGRGIPTIEVDWDDEGSMEHHHLVITVD